MTHTNTKQEQAEFEAWKEDYALTFEPNYNEHLEADCKAAFVAGMKAARRAPAEPVISEAQVLAITTAYEQAERKAAELRRLHARIEHLEEQLVADTVRLNWLDAQVKNHTVYNGFLWRQECGWESDRGLVCVIQDKKQKKTARQAIDAAMAAHAAIKKELSNER